MAHGSSGLCCLKGPLSSQEDHGLEVGKEVSRPHPLLLIMSVPDLSALKCSHPLPILLASHCLHCRCRLYPGPGPSTRGTSLIYTEVNYEFLVKDNFYNCSTGLLLSLFFLGGVLRHPLNPGEKEAQNFARLPIHCTLMWLIYLKKKIVKHP